jgi:hypothetical protein
MQLEVRAISGYRPADKEEVLLAAARYAVMDVPREKAVSPKQTIDIVRRYLAPLDREVFAVLWLDTRHHVIEFDIISVGTVDSAQVPAREVVKKALERNAAACALVHNHPLCLYLPVTTGANYLGNTGFRREGGNTNPMVTDDVSFARELLYQCLWSCSSYRVRSDSCSAREGTSRSPRSALEIR